MTSLYGEGLIQPELIYYDNIVPTNNEINVLKQRLALLQSSDPYNVVEMAIKIAAEQYKAEDAIKARDAAVQRLTDAYISIEQKLEIIGRLENQHQTFDMLMKSSCKSLKESAGVSSSLLEADKLPTETAELEGLVDDLRKEIKLLKETTAAVECDSPQALNGSAMKSQFTAPALSRTSSDLSVMSFAAAACPAKTVLELQENDLDLTIVSSALSEEAEDIINARNKLLAALPVPEEAPDDALKPIIIPTPYVNLYEFLASVSGPLRASLSNYGVLHQLTTSWCPQREEHGYYLTPVFKCNTNPRVTTAHRWAATDVMSKICKPAECFYNKDGVWYYAGVYKAFRLNDLTVMEWEALSSETTQAIVKETIEGRKNTSAQNIYEVTQLYAAGALKVAVIALQCVGFNQSMYHLLLEHASNCTSSAGNVGTTPETRNNSSSTSPSVSLQTSIQSTITKNLSSGASVLGNVNASAGKNGTNANRSRNSAYSLGLGLGLGTGNIWNTNLGVGLAVGSTTRPAGKGLGKGGGKSSNSSSISQFIKASPSARKTHGNTGDENDKPSGILAEMQTQIKM
ncbi:uncharacterized protein C8R40DRAFT_1171028 [Lentinula edodes]|uniref:uncharacterized protein n=1 Tax=Lentinula edodes TaxID=5353 RepID=UPI001E8E489B|nr:uncharacterized protein C8R40DRAFT_1171028 [Lentinula edodes]KAH7874916.1 hypothetical protein C8R40DRAFT_1171028 [Lentinula edodes]